MDTDVSDTFDDQHPEFQRREALRHAASIGCGVVRVTDGVTERTFANSWVEKGKEVVLDLRVALPSR